MHADNAPPPRLPHLWYLLLPTCYRPCLLLARRPVPTLKPRRWYLRCSAHPRLPLQLHGYPLLPSTTVAFPRLFDRFPFHAIPKRKRLVSLFVRIGARAKLLMQRQTAKGRSWARNRLVVIFV